MSGSSALTRGRRKRAIVLYSENRLSEARECCEKVLRLDRRDVEMWVMLGTICRRTGNLPAAVEACRNALHIRSDYAPAYHALGAALQLQGKRVDAAASYRRAIQLRPESVEPRYFLGNLLREAGRLEEALNAYCSVLDIQPDHFETLNNLGALFSHVGRTAEAIGLFERALRQCPGSTELLSNLGDAYLKLGRPDRAVEVFRQVVALNPDLADAYGRLCRALLNCGRIEEALGANAKACALKPDDVELAAQRAHLLEVKGADAEALALLEPLLESHPDVVAQIFFDLSGRLGRREEAAGLLLRQLERPRVPADLASKLHFRLGRYYDEVRDYGLAFEHFRQANNLCEFPFDFEAAERTVDSIIASYTTGRAAKMARATNQSQLPLFIVGMPRSGTTLVEQILAAHSEVYGGGELTGISEVAAGLSARLQGAGYPDFVPRLTTQLLNEQADRYLGMLRQIATSALRVTDKMPHNFLHLGLLRQMFPAARIIHCVRNPLDTCLSCYFSNFGNDMHGYAYNLESLGRYYVQYTRLMEHWHNLFGDGIYKISYRDLVNRQESTSRELLAYCGLNWEECCLAFHRSGHIAYTLSYDQVRQPIYTRSLDRWKNYERFLAGLRRILDAAGIEY